MDQSLSVAVASGREALMKGEAGRARDVLERALAAAQGDAAAWLLLAQARAKVGDEAGKAAAIDEALAREPRSIRALIAKADHLSAAGDLRASSAFYSSALMQASRAGQVPADLRADLERAQAATQRLAREFEDFLRARLDSEGFGAGRTTGRFARSVDILFGKKQIYYQQPRYFHYPELPQIQFYPRGAFPWMDAVEAATDAIRAELDAVLSGDTFGPYLTSDPSRPKRSNMGLQDNPDWGAFFLWKDAKEQPGAARCPNTMAALGEAPLTQIPNRAPSILFSKLAAQTCIPPHHGMINARLICHLPLRVPEGCGFRVGNDVREWVEGKAWAFDDTIEHEAWNQSRVDRYILLFDIWRPELTEEERAGIAALCGAIDEYRGGGAWDA